MSFGNSAGDIPQATNPARSPQKRDRHDSLPPYQPSPDLNPANVVRDDRRANSKTSHANPDRAATPIDNGSIGRRWTTTSPKHEELIDHWRQETVPNEPHAAHITNRALELSDIASKHDAARSTAQTDETSNVTFGKGENREQPTAADWVAQILICYLMWTAPAAVSILCGCIIATRKISPSTSNSEVWLYLLFGSGVVLTILLFAFICFKIRSLRWNLALRTLYTILTCWFWTAGIVTFVKSISCLKKGSTDGYCSEAKVKLASGIFTLLSCICCIPLLIILARRGLKSRSLESLKLSN